MYALIVLLLILIVVLRHAKNKHQELLLLPHGLRGRLTKLWEIAHHGMRENRFLRAEKALLTILKIDEKNAAAYNRLGILYAKQREYRDAIDCFEIASSIEPSPSSLHNLGLIYYETENYHKASMAFEQALKLEDDLAARHIAYAKVQEKLGNDKLMIIELERAVELEPNQESYSLLANAYESRGMDNELSKLTKKIGKITSPSNKQAKLIRPKRVVI
jgi:tetratricopeptide (TPR) repeat protein